MDSYVNPVRFIPYCGSAFYTRFIAIECGGWRQYNYRKRKAEIT